MVESCWHCTYNLPKATIKDANGCCIRCGTNLNKKKAQRPNLGVTALGREVLGTRCPCKIIQDDTGQTITVTKAEKTFMQKTIPIPREEILNKYSMSSSSASFKENILSKSIPKKGKLRPNKEKYEGWKYGS